MRRRRLYRKKVVATVSRCECVYKRTGEPSVPFCEKGGTTARVTDFSHKKNRNEVKSVPTWLLQLDSNHVRLQHQFNIAAQNDGSFHCVAAQLSALP